MAELVYDITRSSKQSLLIKFHQFKGLKLCDIRKYYKERADSEIFKPTQKGISLNESQLFEFVKILNNNAIEIADFFQISDDISINIKNTDLIGRQFSFDYKNGETELNIGRELTNRMTEEQIVFFSKILDAVYRAVTEVFEDDVDYLLDVLNQKINRVI
jgi:hypothetical protein